MDSIDVSSGRLLEMFEARFGKVAGTILLAMIALAIATFTGRIILSGLVLPVYEVVNAIVDGHQSVMAAMDKFASSRLTPFLTATVWTVMAAWFAHNLIHDGYTAAKRRQIMRDAEVKFNSVVERHNIWRWMRDNEADAKEIIARLDNAKRGVGPIVDDAFMLRFLTNPPAEPPQPPAQLGKPEGT